MFETPETKAKVEAVLEKARRLHPLRQYREMLVMELGNIPNNLVALELNGKTLFGEKARVEGEIEKVRQQEQALRQEVREFFVRLVKASVAPISEKILTAVPKRQRLRALLAEAAAVYCDLEQVQKDWKTEADALKKVARELSEQTHPGASRELYTNIIPELPFVSPWVPAPTLQQANRARNQADNIAEILQEMARQIG